MPSEIRQVAVIGSGVMGSQIAAQVANAGVPVLLLDIVPKDAADKSVLAKKALDRMGQEPSPFMHADAAKLVIPGNIDDDLDKLRTCDIIFEAVVENGQIKSSLYKKIDSVRKPGTIVASNTSTIPLAKLIAGQSPAFAKDFMIALFFNPVRFMPLLELVTGPETLAGSVEKMRDFCDRALGKTVVPCLDTPGFIANRLGMFWLQSAINAAMDLGLTVEEADAVCGAPMGIPSTGIFGLIDLIGLDLMPLIGKSLVTSLSRDDVYRRIYQEPELFRRMVADGYTGRKGKGGYYRFVENETGGKVKESINLETGAYAPSVVPKIPALEEAGGNLRVLCEINDKIGQFAWRVLSETLVYAFELIPATVPDVTLIDAGMKMGYNWTFGPFELIDKLGADWMIARLREEARDIPLLLAKASGRKFYRVHGGRVEAMQTDGSYEPAPRAPGVLIFSDIKLATKPIEKNGAAALWDLGDGVMALELTAQNGVLDRDFAVMIHQAIARIGDGSGVWKGLVLCRDAEVFSTGLDLRSLCTLIRNGDDDALAFLIQKVQSAMLALRFAPFPSVAAPLGTALSGGAELLLSCSAVQAYCEASIGFDAAYVGLTPVLGGCAHMLARAFAQTHEPVPPVNRVFDFFSAPRMAQTAAEAKALGLLRATDGITMNKDRLLFDAKQRVLDFVRAGYQPPQPQSLSLPGQTGAATFALILESGALSAQDKGYGKTLSDLLCGAEISQSDNVSEQMMMEAERKAFINLCKAPETLARVEAALEKH